jgi:glucose/mannose transport system permease protein
VTPCGSLSGTRSASPPSPDGPLLPVPAIRMSLFSLGKKMRTTWLALSAMMTSNSSSISNWSSLAIDLSVQEPWWGTYAAMASMFRFQSALRNTIIFTVLFLALSVGGGLILAILLHHTLFGKAFFRTAFLLPYSLSFIVTGVAWRWLFNPNSGINLLFEMLGVNAILARAGVGPLQPGWLTDATVVGSVNDALATVVPPASFVQAELGIPLALIPVVIAATWQLSGFAMAMYLAGLSTIPDDVVEAARVDGANYWQTYRNVVVPMLWPITVTILVILGHVSLKIFDLVFAMAGPGPNFVTDVPGIFMFEQTFQALRYNLGAAASIVMLVMVAVVVVPYLLRSARRI